MGIAIALTPHALVLAFQRWLPERFDQLRQRLRLNRDEALHTLGLFFLLYGCMALGIFLMVTASAALPGRIRTSVVLQGTAALESGGAGDPAARRKGRERPLSARFSGARTRPSLVGDSSCFQSTPGG